mmetsp:Transcript_51529/g.76872  ORF Transcript_51529/g.76872 Transcript_51529/m.76872 type:complete len:80 (-) Transcript_51529:233-472(-)
MGWFSIAGSFLLSMFLSGLLNLAKMLFDPIMDNDDFEQAHAGSIQIVTLIQKSADASHKYARTGYQWPLGAIGVGRNRS